MKKYYLIVFRIFLGSVFLSSGLLKAFDLGSFTNALMNFNYIDRSLIDSISVILPFTEIVIGLMLIFGYMIRFVCVSAIILLSIFEIVIFNQLLVDNKVSCGCFGIFYQSQTDVFSLIRNFLLILILYHLAKQNVFLFSLDFYISQIHKTVNNYNQFKKNGLETISLTIIFILISISLEIKAPSLVSSFGVPFQSKRDVDSYRSLFLNTENIKKTIRNLEPEVDSVKLYLIDKNIEKYKLYYKDKFRGDYFAVMHNVRCKLCNNLHYLIKLDNKYIIKNIVFLSNIHKTTQSEIVNQYINKDIRRLFLSDIYPNAKVKESIQWRYYFLKGLRDVRNKL